MARINWGRIYYERVANEWKDIREEKPDCCKAILVLCPSYSFGVEKRLMSDQNGYLFLIPRIGKYICGTECFDLIGAVDKNASPRDIRYWMPLPEAVKYKEEDGE